MQTTTVLTAASDKAAAAPVRQQDAEPKQTQAQQYRGSSTAEALLRLQRTHGNRFVQRVIQAKLEVSHPGDPYEQEADQVADRIMSMPMETVQPVAQRTVIPEEEKEEKTHDQTIAASRTEEDEIQNGVLPNAEEAVSAASNSTGQPLPPNLQRKFEHGLGVDLSAVRLHTGPQSVEANKAISARAYTTGNDIHFNQSQYAPESAEGQRLLAHEVTHTVQQQGAARRDQHKLNVQSKGGGSQLPDTVQTNMEPRIGLTEHSRALSDSKSTASQRSADALSTPTKTTVEPNRQFISASIKRVGENTKDIRGDSTTRENTVTKLGYMGAYHDPLRGLKAVKLGNYHDAKAGNEETMGIDLASLSPQTDMAGSIPEPQDGETVLLPDIRVSPMGGGRETDTIASALTYNPSVTQSGTASPFGETQPYTFVMSNITVTPTAGTFNVTATLDNPITFQVSSGGNTNISSDSDPHITQSNYPTVVSDLTPTMSDLNGRPPRTLFWAEDLCIRHERFHSSDGIGHSRSGVILAQNWLNTQVAASAVDVHNLLGQVPARVAATRRAAMTFPGREERAYGDGAPLYLARANAIKTKGDAGRYGTPAGTTAAPGGGPAGTTGASGGLSTWEKAGIGALGGAAIGGGVGFLLGGPLGAAVGAGIGAIAGGIASLLF